AAHAGSPDGAARSRTQDRERRARERLRCAGPGRGHARGPPVPAPGAHARGGSGEGRVRAHGGGAARAVEHLLALAHPARAAHVHRPQATLLDVSSAAALSTRRRDRLPVADVARSFVSTIAARRAPAWVALILLPLGAQTSHAQPPPLLGHESVAAVEG